MADQSSARPKWIPSYEQRKNSSREHASKWSTEVFQDSTALTQEQFVANVKQLSYAPPLGGPYVAASAAEMGEGEEATLVALYQILSQGKDKLTKMKMSKRLKELANGEEGVTWNMFQAAFADTITHE